MAMAAISEFIGKHHGRPNRVQVITTRLPGTIINGVGIDDSSNNDNYDD
jgi:hypothetical protein